MEQIYGKNKLLMGENKFCPGCGHSTVCKLIAEVLTENGWEHKAVTALCIGCAINVHPYVNWDLIQCPHGRAAAVATGAKRINKDALVFTYQGDGDAAGIGLTETYHAASRGEAITAIMINNQVYGMTGGQTSCTTLVGQRTTTTDKNGRNPETTGYPTRLAEAIAQIDAAAYVARVSLHTPKHVIQAKKAIEKAFRLQMEEGKYSFIEILSICPTNFHLPPDKCPQYEEEKVIPVFPLGVFKSPDDK